MSTRKQLKQLVEARSGLIVPGAFNALSARVIADLGFKAIYVTGAGVTNMWFGLPDQGFMGLAEIADHTARIRDAVNLPLIVDADTGFGNALNVRHAVRTLERAGADCIQLEDQVAPKRCGHLDGKEVIPRGQFVAKIRAALEARRDPAFLVIARTDARAMLGLDEAVERARAALAAGADMVFVEAAQSMEELESIPRRVEGPCLLNIVRGGKTPDLSLAAAQDMGYRMAILPSLLIGAAASACEQALSTLRSTGQPPSSAQGPGVAERFRRLGADEWDALRTRFDDAQ